MPHWPTVGHQAWLSTFASLGQALPSRFTPVDRAINQQHLDSPARHQTLWIGIDVERGGVIATRCLPLHWQESHDVRCTSHQLPTSLVLARPLHCRLFVPETAPGSSQAYRSPT